MRDKTERVRTNKAKRESEPLLMTVDETAALLRISRETAYKAVRRNEIPSVRFCGRIMVPRRRLLRMLDGD